MSEYFPLSSVSSGTSVQIAPLVIDLTVRRADGSTSSHRLTIPGSKEKQRPIVVPERVVTASKLADGIGLIRISMFPGVLGIDVARDISRAVAELACDRLICDLRGNTGGGIGCLRVMSHLCADRRGVGYSMTRDMMKNGFDSSESPRYFGHPRRRPATRDPWQEVRRRIVPSTVDGS